MSPDQGSLIALPPHIEEPFEVFVNGVAQQPGRDYELRGRTIEFARVLGQEGKLSPMRWLLLFFGVAGTYRGQETVDIVYVSDGRRLVETGLQVEAD